MQEFKNEKTLKNIYVASLSLQLVQEKWLAKKSLSKKFQSMYVCAL